jgi:hypothetical protein
MDRNAAPSNARRSLQKWRLWVTASVVGAMCFFLSADLFKAYGQTRSTEVVQAELRDFFEVFLGRQLSPNEMKQVTREFIALFGASTCEAKCTQALATNKTQLAILKTKPGQPEDLVTRHIYIASSYFSPLQRGSLIQRLLSEPDPIRVVNPKTKRLMTQRDVVALANLGILLRSHDLPKNQSFSPKEIEEAVVLLESAVGSHAKAHKMPILFGVAAELWAGVQREWPALNANERQIVRDYIQHKSAKPMSVNLYSRLLGLSSAQAKEILTSERVEGQSTRLWGKLSRYLDLMGQSASNNEIIRSIQSIPSNF